MSTAQMETRGRPPTKSSAICQRILEGVRSGLTLRKAASGAGITERTLRRWSELDSKFAAELEAARMVGFQAQNRLKAEKNLSKSQKPASDKIITEARDKIRRANNSKRTSEVIERILETAGSGLPLRFCAAAGGVSLETVSNWREQDLDFSQALETARAAGARKKWDKILAAGDRDAPGSWQPLAWALERGFPAEFSRPEIQLAAVQSNFVQNNSLAITVELAKNLEARSAPIHKKIEQLFAKRGSRQQQLEAPSDVRIPATLAAEMKPPLLTMPADPVPARWWIQLVKGNNTREIERETAVRVCKMVLEDVVGKQRAQSTLVEFDPDWPILLRDVHTKLESLCGARGWESLVRRGKARK
jgi:hypothetical protein